MAEYVGFDVSKEATAFCVMDAAGKVLARGKVASDPEALFEVLREHCLFVRSGSFWRPGRGRSGWRASCASGAGRWR